MYHHHSHILYDIRTLLGPGIKTYAELGTHYGGSLSLMLLHEYETEIYCIDPLNTITNQEHIFNKNINKFNKYNRTITIYKNSDFKLEDFKTDILYIGGRGSASAINNDFHLYKDCVNDGGFIIIDNYEDYKWSPQVKVAVDNICTYLDPKSYAIIGMLPNIKSSYDQLGLKTLNEFII